MYQTLKDIPSFGEIAHVLGRPTEEIKNLGESLASSQGVPIYAVKSAFVDIDQTITESGKAKDKNEVFAFFNDIVSTIKIDGYRLRHDSI